MHTTFVFLDYITQVIPHHIFFINSWVEGHLSCFQLVAITHRTAMTTAEQLPLWYYGKSFWYMSTIRIALYIPILNVILRGKSDFEENSVLFSHSQTHTSFSYLST